MSFRPDERRQADGDTEPNAASLRVPKSEQQRKEPVDEEEDHPPRERKIKEEEPKDKQETRGRPEHVKVKKEVMPEDGEMPVVTPEVQPPGRGRKSNAGESIPPPPAALTVSTAVGGGAVEKEKPAVDGHEQQPTGEGASAKRAETGGALRGIIKTEEEADEARAGENTRKNEPPTAADQPSSSAAAEPDRSASQKRPRGRPTLAYLALQAAAAEKATGGTTGEIEEPATKRKDMRRSGRVAATTPTPTTTTPTMTTSMASRGVPRGTGSLRGKGRGRGRGRGGMAGTPMVDDSLARGSGCGGASTSAAATPAPAPPAKRGRGRPRIYFDRPQRPYPYVSVKKRKEMERQEAALERGEGQEDGVPQEKEEEASPRAPTPPPPATPEIIWITPDNIRTITGPKKIIRPPVVQKAVAVKPVDAPASTNGEGKKKDQKKGESMAEGTPSQSAAKKETSFTDLPDNVLIKIFKYLDTVSRLKLRKTKRLNELHRSVKSKMDKIILCIARNSSYYLDVTPSNRPSRYQSTDFDELVKGLDLMALIMKYQSILVFLRRSSHMHNGSIIDAVSNIEADELEIHSSDFGYNLDQVNLSTILSLAQNLRQVKIEVACPSITAKHLCALRMTMLEGKCKLESFSLVLDKEDKVASEIVKECFGVTVEASPNGDCMYRTTDESVELHYDPRRSRLPSLLYHYKEDLETQVDFSGKFALKKCEGGTKPESEYEKIRMNHLYSR